MTFDDLLEELAQPKRDVWIGNDVIQGASPAMGEPPEQPPEPLPQPSAPIASTDDSFRPEPQQARSVSQAPSDDAPTYDWRRALAQLFSGDEGVANYDRQKLAEASQRLAQQKADTASRRESREGALADSLIGKRGAEVESIQAKTAKLDPNSPQSKQAVQMMADRIEAKAARLPDGQAKDMMQKFVQNARAGYAVDAVEASKWAQMLGTDVSDIMKGLQFDRQQTNRERATDAQIANMAETRKQAWARINAARARALQPKKPSERVKAAQAKNQEKLDDEIEKADWARNALLTVADLKSGVNTGPLAGRGQNLLQLVDLAPESYNKLKQRLQQVSNRIIKELSGSAVTGNEWMRMQDELANILDDDNNFDIKLAGMIELAESIKQMAINRYTRGETGAPVQPSNTAKRSTNQPSQIVEGEQRPPSATPGKTPAPAGSKPGQVIRQKSTGKTFKVTPEMTLEEVQ